ncbi:hypothetical protein FVE85_4635 [Porphyridium purpureum]|uniref:Uncharacterized protein n=1 Tax=Porphyridium purpureum TaxID=35688 RepID=A0A5J4YQA4_PORPP|nr:hypothetical protein FVE85_4635 [Porphyridium purpureum]|eukprot:POR9339..scf236_6
MSYSSMRIGTAKWVLFCMLISLWGVELMRPSAVRFLGRAQVVRPRTNGSVRGQLTGARTLVVVTLTWPPSECHRRWLVTLHESIAKVHGRFELALLIHHEGNIKRLQAPLEDFQARVPQAVLKVWRYRDVLNTRDSNGSCGNGTSQLHTFGTKGKLVGPKPFFLKWLGSMSEEKAQFEYVWHLEDDLELVGDRWDEFLVAYENSTAHVISPVRHTPSSPAEFRDIRSKGCQSLCFDLRKGARKVIPDTQKIMWYAVRISRRLLRHMYDELEAGNAQGQHEIVLGTLCAREDWCTYETLHTEHAGLFAAGSQMIFLNSSSSYLNMRQCCQFGDSPQRLGILEIYNVDLAKPKHGGLYHPIKLCGSAELTNEPER